MKNALVNSVYTDFVEHPSWRDTKIARKYNVHRTTIMRIRKKFMGRVDYCLAQQVAGKFLTEFQQASDYFKIQIERLEASKARLEDMLQQTSSTGQEEEETLTPTERADIITRINATERQQTDLWKNILELARQGEAVEVMRLIRDGRIQPPSG